MKFSECNKQQQKAWRNIKAAADWHMGGLINTLQDELPGSVDYEEALATVKDLDGLVSTVYTMAINEVYMGTGIGSNATQLKNIRFCGKEFLMQVVTLYCKRYQREALEN